MKEQSIQKQLIERRNELEARLQKLKSDISQPLDHDFEEQAVQLENGEVLDALAVEAQEEIQKINHALIRIEEGHYGECSECGEPIDPERLAIRPYSSRCVTCAASHE